MAIKNIKLSNGQTYPIDNDLSNVIDLSPYRTLKNEPFPSSGTLSSEGVALVQNNWDKNVLFRWDYYTISFYLVPSMKLNVEGQTSYVLFATTTATMEQQDYFMGVWLVINSGKNTDNYMCQSTRAYLDLKQDKTDNSLNTADKTIVGAINEVNTNLSSHTSNTNNPHSVTKEQVGLGSVVNAGQTSVPTESSNGYFTAGGAYTLQQSLNSSISTKQDKTDNTLATTSKTIVGAINEINAKIPALPEDATTKTYVLKAVNGVFQWVEEAAA